MCTSCVTTFDTVTMHAAAALSVGSAGWRRWRDLRVGRSPAHRRRDDYEANAEFLRSIELDPLEVLGPPPPVPEPAPSRAAPAPAAAPAPHPSDSMARPGLTCAQPSSPAPPEQDPAVGG